MVVEDDARRGGRSVSLLGVAVVVMVVVLLLDEASIRQRLCNTSCVRICRCRNRGSGHHLDDPNGAVVAPGGQDVPGCQLTRLPR